MNQVKVRFWGLPAWPRRWSSCVHARVKQRGPGRNDERRAGGKKGDTGKRKTRKLNKRGAEMPAGGCEPGKSKVLGSPGLASKMVSLFSRPCPAEGSWVRRREKTRMEERVRREEDDENVKQERGRNARRRL